MLDLITYMQTSQNYRKLYLLNVEWRDYFIWLANFCEMLMIDVINKMLLNAIINLVSFFVNKFTLSIMTLNNVIYCCCLLHFCSILLLLLLCSITIALYQ